MYGKNELRRRLKNISVELKDVKNRAINANLIGLAEFVSANNIFVFCAAGNEPDLTELINKSYACGKRVFFPVTDNGAMFFAETDINSPFAVGEYGIRIPKVAVPATVLPDLIVVPAVAYDVNLDRLGHGKGYYDRFLKDTSCFKVGCVFSDFLVDNVFPLSHDIKVDALVTENGVTRRECK